MNVVIYCRVSSRDQIDGTSLESQETACRDFCVRKGWTISKIFIEEGESAKFADRTKLLELLAYCQDKNQQIEVLLVWKLDRFARNIEDHYMIKATLRRMNVRVVSVTEPVDNDPNGKLMEAILAGFAQFDNDIRSMRTVTGMQQRVQEGIRPWAPPLGYLPPRIGKKKEPDRPDPDRFELLKKAWRLYATGGYTKAEIIGLLRSWQLTTRHGAPISPQTLDTTFRNRYYTGIVADPWTGREYQGRHMPMVTLDEFARDQQVIKTRNRSLSHNRVHKDFSVRGIVRCARCLWPMTAAWSRGAIRRHAYYACHQRTCERYRTSIRAAAVHDEFFGFLPCLMISVDRLNAVMVALAATHVDNMERLKEVARRRKDRVASLDHELHEVIAMKARGLITDVEFEKHRNTLRDEIDKQRADALKVDVRPLTHAETNEMIRIMANLPALWDRLPLSERYAFGRVLFPVGYPFEGIRTAEKGRLFSLFGDLDGEESNLVASVKKHSNELIIEIRKLLAIGAKANNIRADAA